MTNLVPRLEFLAQALVRRQRECPYCGASDTRVVARKLGLIRVRCCAQCSLAFTDPLYDRSVFGALYDGLYEGEGSTTRPPASGELAELEARAFAGTDKDVGDRLRRLRALSPGTRLLELGCSWGYCLHQARTLGFDPVGVELSSPRRAYAERELGLRVVPALADLGADERFDLVYTAHVLEHFTRLHGVFEALFARLSPGGLLALEVPHFDLAGRGRAALASVGAVHPLGFTSDFFARALPAAGFAIQGFFDAWDDVPWLPVARCGGAEVIVLARRPEEGSA